MLEAIPTTKALSALNQGDNLPSLMDQVMNNFAKEIASKRDDVLKDAFLKNGFDTNEEFIKAHISLITYEGDDFDHIWYHFGKPDAVRIISIERHPQTSLFDENDVAKMTWELRYY